MNKKVFSLITFFLLLSFIFISCDIEENNIDDILDPGIEPSGWVTRHNLSAASYQEEFDKWTDQGMRLTYVNCHNYNGEIRYNAIWEHRSGPSWAAIHGYTAAQYQDKVDEMKDKGYQPVLVNPANVNGTVYFAAIFEDLNFTWIARHGLTAAEYQNEFETNAAAGYRLRFVAGYQSGGEARFAGIWDTSSGPAYAATHGVTSSQYQSLVDTYQRDGFQPVLVDGYYIGRTPYFSAIWHKKNDRWSARHQVAITDYQDVFEDYYYQAYRPKVVAGYGNGSLTNMAFIYNNYIWDTSELDYINNAVEQFRQANSVEAISLAITVDERLVYAAAFGMADVESNEDAHTSHRFRIASNSKAITGAAISQLLDEGEIALNDLVFGPGSLLGNQFAMPADQADIDRVQDIRVRHLVEHTSGGWGNANNDPIFIGAYVNDSRDTFINNVLQNVPLVNDPGDNYAYSNFGYNVLEVIIEDESGKSYEQYIRDEFLTPSGANSFAIATNTLAERLSNEVKYYGGSAYSWNYERMAGHGGWVCTPVDYLRLMTRLDGFSNRADLLSTNGMSIFMTSDENPVNESANFPYAKGIAIGSNRWTHNGRLSGQSSLYDRYNDGFSIFIVTNNNAGGDLPGNFNALSSDLRNNVANWPSINLF